MEQALWVMVALGGEWDPATQNPINSVSVAEMDVGTVIAGAYATSSNRLNLTLRSIHTPGKIYCHKKKAWKAN